MTMTEVAVAVLHRNGTVLACQRKKNARYGLKWEFPGGKLEPGESVTDCLRRELWEELRLTISRIDRVEVERASYDDGHDYSVSYCHVSSFSGEPENVVFEQIRWVTPAELLHLDILHGNRAVAERLRER